MEQTTLQHWLHHPSAIDRVRMQRVPPPASAPRSPLRPAQQRVELIFFPEPTSRFAVRPPHVELHDGFRSAFKSGVGQPPVHCGGEAP